MAITRQGNWLGQMRADVPDFRALESAVANDFDLLAGKIWGGKQPWIIRGFSIPITNAAGNAATALQLNVSNGLMFHFNATEAGTLLEVDFTRTTESLSTSNARVIGSFASNALNYIGLDYTRYEDSSTSDMTKFLDPNTKQETERRIPKARILDYRIIITTAPFSFNQNVSPIAIVQTDVNGNVVSITDARQLMFRLAPGGDTPNADGTFIWADSARRENAITYDSILSPNDPFSKGDKDIFSMKEWMNAVMSVLWEAKSGESWYSPTSRDMIKVAFAPILLGNGTNFDWNSGTSTLTWSGIRIIFENSSGSYYNIVTDSSTVLAAGECLYVDIDRTTDPAATIVAVVGTLQSLPSPIIPGSRVILAWRLGADVFVHDYPFDISRTVVNAATTTTDGVVRLNATPGSVTHPVVISVQANGTASITASGGNANGFSATGNGTGSGLFGTGGSGNANGVSGLGHNTGAGVFGTGGGSNGPGLKGQGGGTGGFGLEAYGPGGGIFTQAGTSSGSDGTESFGDGAGRGVYGVGGNSSGIGVYGQGGTGGHGMLGGGQGAGDGIQGYGGGISGRGVYGEGGGTGAGGVFDGPGTGTAATDDAIISHQNIHLSGSNPVNTTGFSNRLTPKNICKAWASGHGQGVSAPHFHDGFNCTTTATNDHTIAVAFVTPLADANYAVMVSVPGFGPGSTVAIWFVGSKTTSGFNLIYFESATTIDNSAVPFDFVVFGAQTP